MVDDVAVTAGAGVPFFVTADWLQERLGAPGLRVVQIGTETHYPRAHVPGAVLVGYGEFTVQRDGLPGMRPDAEALARLFGRLGIAADTTVVAYDAAGGADAARLLWTLACMGHTGGLAVLDGGLSVWLLEQRPIEASAPVIAPVVYRSRPDDAWEADRERALVATRDGAAAQLLDTRTRNEYVGLTMKMPRGHLRQAAHLDWLTTLRGRQDPRLLPLEVLRARLAAVGVTDPEREVIVYCESGYRASQTWALLRHLGWRKVRLYDGSMAEWRVCNLPVVAGETPG